MWKKLIVVVFVIACVATTAIEDDLEELKEDAKAAKEEREELKLRLRYHDYSFVGFGVFIAFLIMAYCNHKCSKCAQGQNPGQNPGQNQSQNQVGACFVNAQHSNKLQGVSFHEGESNVTS